MNEDAKTGPLETATAPRDCDSVNKINAMQFQSSASVLSKSIKMAGNCRNISDEVFPGILVGDKGAARNTFYLKMLGVTHVLNTAEGKRDGHVDTCQAYYLPHGIKYKGLRLMDVSTTNIAKHFNEVAEFIDEALAEGGKVLVNCQMGMSRSSTCVLAYLMLRQHMTAEMALNEVRKHRYVRPNDGFLKQLFELDTRLKRERGLLKGKA